MLDLDAPPLLDDFIGARLKLHHRRYVCGDGVGSPHLGVDDTVERPAQLLNGSQTGQRVLVS